MLLKAQPGAYHQDDTESSNKVSCYAQHHGHHLCIIQNQPIYKLQREASGFCYVPLGHFGVVGTISIYDSGAHLIEQAFGSAWLAEVFLETEPC